jgi:Lar family restriction alleviation protein
MKLHVEKCPFCGGDDVEFQRGTTDSEGVPTSAMCVECGATGPGVYEVDDRNFLKALDAWNDRG